MAGSSARAARSSRSSSKKEDTDGSRRRWGADMNPVSKTFVAEWESAARRPANNRSPELDRVRDAAWQRFLSTGFPTTRDEEWRFTNVGPIAEGGFSLAPSALPPGAAGDLSPFRLP